MPMKYKAAKKAAENPFEKFANSRKKHEVLNRRVKGEDRNVGRARLKAVEDRKKTLLSEYVTSRKSNTFSDRRFGEDDPSLSLDDKLFQRFQREKMKKVKKASKFALDSTESTVLTHRGQALGEATFNDEEWNESSDDENIAKEAVSRLHFGGGLVEAEGMRSNSTDGGGKKTHADVLQEIVMKSKLFKLEKKEAKDAQEGQRELIDKAYDDLVDSAMLEFKPTKRDRSETRASGEVDEYDTMLRSLAFESKVQASNRSESAEEIAKAAQKRQQTLEGERLKRMKMEHVVLAPALSLPGKGSAAPVLNDDCIYELYEDYAARNGNDISGNVDAEYSDTSSDGDDTDDSAEFDDGPDVAVDTDGIYEDTLMEWKPVPPAVSVPQNLSAFEALCSQHVHCNADMTTLLDGITGKSLSATTDDNAKLLNILLECIVKKGDSLCFLSHENDLLAKIDKILPALSRIALSAPDRCTRAVQKMLTKIQNDMTTQLKLFASGDVSSCWPSLGQSMLLQQLSVLYSSSDFRHGIITPALMILCRCLSQCPVSNMRDLAKGSLLCCIVLNLTEKTKEVVPELKIFIANAFNALRNNDIYLSVLLEKDLQLPDAEFMNISQNLPWRVFDKGSPGADNSALEAAPSLYMFLKMIKCVEQHYRSEPFFADTSHMISSFFSSKQHMNTFLTKSCLGSLGGSADVTNWQPLQWRKAQKKIDTSLAPSFDLHYTMKKVSASTDADVEKLKALKRQMKREKKASMRELRKDSMFLGTESYLEKTQRKADIREERSKNYSWLQDQHASFNQQVRMGKVEMKGGGTNGLKAVRKNRKPR